MEEASRPLALRVSWFCDESTARMNNMTEEELENLAADSMAQSVILEYLLSVHLRACAERRYDIARALLNAGERTEHFSALQLTEEQAATFSSVVVKMHAALDVYVGRALKRFDDADRRAAEDSAPQS